MTWKKGDDGQYVRTVRCGHCFDVGHNSSSCPAKKRYIEKMREEHPDSYTVRNYDKAQSNRKKRSRNNNVNYINTIMGAWIILILITIMLSSYFLSED